MTPRILPMSLADFEHMLDVYGSDRTRWPLAGRASAAATLATDEAARQLLCAAQALDAVLLHAPEPDPAYVSEVAARIVAAAATTPRLAVDRDVSKPRSVRVSMSASRARDRGFWGGVAVLAASLLVGVFVGQSQVGAGAVPALETLTGVSLSGTDDRVALSDIHLADTHIDLIEED